MLIRRDYRNQIFATLTHFALRIIIIITIIIIIITIIIAVMNAI